MLQARRSCAAEVLARRRHHTRSATGLSGTRFENGARSCGGDGRPEHPVGKRTQRLGLGRIMRPDANPACRWVFHDQMRCLQPPREDRRTGQRLHRGRDARSSGEVEAGVLPRTRRLAS